MKSKDLRVVFMGTPDFGLHCLDMLKEEGFNLVACISQPDRKAGRGHKMQAPPVKVWAIENNIPVYQFEKISKEGIDTLKELAPDVCVTAAFGQILSEELLSIPKYGVFNVHASLLPKLRGSAPIQWAIINGDEKSGVTIMRTVYKLDAGDIIMRDELDIPPEMNAGELYDKLSVLGAKTLKKALYALITDKITYTPQNEEEHTYFPMFKKDFGLIDFNEDAKKIYDFVRGTYPYPGCFFMYNDAKIKVLKADFEIKKHNYVPGQIICADRKKGLQIACGDGIINILEIQCPGKKPVSVKDYFLGNSFETGTVLENK